jgi:CheY-specific phosphatase CheX
VKGFQQAAGGKYAVTAREPSTFATEVGEATDVKGVVVFYKPETGTPDSEWFARVRQCVDATAMPLIVVAHAPSYTTRAQLIAAGASAVCDATDGPGLVLEEVENRCNVEPVIQELRDQLLEPFIESTLLTLQEMAQARVEATSVYRKLGYRIYGDYSALVSLTAQSEGTLIMTFPAATAHELSKRVLAPLGVETTEELIQSVIGEITNILVGQAKGRLSDTSFRFMMSVPTVVAGPHHEIKYKQGLPCLVASFTSDIGDFALQVCMAF